MKKFFQWLRLKLLAPEHKAIRALESRLAASEGIVREAAHRSNAIAAKYEALIEGMTTEHWQRVADAIAKQTEKR